MSDEIKDQMDAFEEIDSTYSPSSSRRQPKGGVAYPTGLLPLNLNGSDQLTQLMVDSKQDRDTCEVILRANLITRTIAAEVVPANTPRAQAFRRNADKRTYTLYLHPVFEKYPLLRPDGRIRVGVTRGMAKGKECLLISLKGLTTRTTKREDENNSQSNTENA